MIAVNDNLTYEEFKAGVEPRLAPAPITRAAVMLAAGRFQERWALLRARFLPPYGNVIEAIALQPHPACPKWDGKTPAMSNMLRAPIAPRARAKPRPDYLRLVE